MKWIGQHIYDLVARFRNDVYLEDISTGTIASGGNLGLDSNNKIVKATSSGGIAFDGSTANGILTYKDSDEATVESNFTFDGSTLSLTGALSVTGDVVTFTSANADDPILTIQNTTNDDQAAQLYFVKNRGAAGQDDDNVAEFKFYGYNDAGTPEQIMFGAISCEIDDATDGEESGRININVASHNGGSRRAFLGQGGSTSNEVDVTLGNGAASVTTVAGTLTMGSTATINNSGVIQVAAQTVIDHDQLANFVAAEHYRWDNDIGDTATIHTNNITDLHGAGVDGSTAQLLTDDGDGTVTSNTYLTFVNTDNISTLTLKSNQDVGDLCSISTTTHGATTITTTDDDAAAAHFEIAADGDIILDAAGTIKLEGPTRSTGQLHMTHHSFTADIDTTKHYVGLVDADSESTGTTGIDMPLVFPIASKLLQVTLRSNKNLSALTYTWRLETQATGVGFGTGPTIVGTQSGSGPAQTGHTTYDFTTSLDSGDNIIDAFDAVYLSLQSSGATANTKYYITCVWETDMSGY
jgi:hypothetical protein